MVQINFADLSTSGLEDHALTAAAGETLINFGDLTTSGDLANGIFAGENDVTIFHFGSIETSGLGAVGIFVEGEDARIVNYGSVHTTGDYFGDFEAFSEGIFVLRGPVLHCQSRHRSGRGRILVRHGRRRCGRSDDQFWRSGERCDKLISHCH